MSKRNRPRRTQTAQTAQTKTVLQAFRNEVSNDFNAFDSMVLSLAPGEGVGVKEGRLAKIHFWPKRFPPKPGQRLNW